MNVTLTKAQAEYLDRVRDELVDLPQDDLDEVIQDLQAHLVELDDSDLGAELGTPQEFAHEFRISAGLEGPLQTRRPTRFRSALSRLEERLTSGSRRLRDLTRWQTIRPLWVWTRGWVLVGAWSILYYEEGLRHFPIPSLGYSSLAGLVFVAIATAISVWVDREQNTDARRIGTWTFSTLAGLGLLATLFNPLPDPRTQFVEVFEPYEMISPTGKPIHNIYAFDLDGNPVEVLLFDQDGEPLMTMSEWLHDDAQVNDGQAFFGEGAVRFRQDEFGRIIPNLYPLVLFRHDPMGNLQPVPPPTVGFPRTADNDHEEIWPGTPSDSRGGQAEQ